MTQPKHVDQSHARPLRILSLGAGVQSSTVLLMSCRGELPTLDAAIFADTQWEPKAVYENLEWLKGEAARARIPVHIVTAGSLREEGLRCSMRDGKAFIRMPVYTRDRETGELGMVRRQCTGDYKIDPINRFIKAEFLGIAPGKRWPTEPVIDLWQGISADEIKRLNSSKDRWKRHIFPLCNLPDTMLPRWYRRADCIEWLATNYPGRTFPRSACIGCPFRSNAEWKSLTPEELADAIEFDEATRQPGGIRGDVFLHWKGVPLRGLDFRSDIERGQLTLWSQECLGMCGV